MPASASASSKPCRRWVGMWKSMSNSWLAPMCAISRWPRAIRCSVASRATPRSSTVRVDRRGFGPPIAITGRSSSMRRSVSASPSSSEIAMTPSTRWRRRNVSKIVSRSAAVGGEAVQRDVVAAAHERRRDPAQHRAEEPAVEERHEHADVAGAARCEARRRRRDDVAEALRRGLDARAGGVRDVSAAAQRARDRRRRDARVLRDLIDADHVVTLISRSASPRGRLQSTASHTVVSTGSSRTGHRAARRDHDTARKRDRPRSRGSPRPSHSRCGMPRRPRPRPSSQVSVPAPRPCTRRCASSAR